MTTDEMVESNADSATEDVEVLPNAPSAPTTRERFLAAARSSVLLGAVLSALAWPVPVTNLVPKRGIDNNWYGALAMAADQRLHFGSEIVFNFGPLGFLTSHRLWFAWTAILSFLFSYALMVGVFAALVSALRTRLNLALACVVAYVCGYPLASVWREPDLVLVLAFVASIRLLSRAREARFRRWEWIAFGMVAGVMSLQKVSIGVGVGLLALVTLICAPSNRRTAALHLVPSAFGVFLAGWFLTGNRIGDIAGYARGTKEISSGYSSAMALDPSSSHTNDIWLAVAGAIAVLVVACLYARRLRTAPRVQVGVVLVTFLTTWLLFKEGFVRPDLHRIVFFAALPLLFAAFAYRPAGDDRGSGRISPSAVTGLLLVGMLLPAFIVFNAVPAFPDHVYQPQVALRDLYDTVTTLALPSRRHEVMRDARARLASQYAVPASMIARTAGQTVDIDPISQTVAWAYPTMRWRPLPTIQDYNAYTSAQDQLDVDFIASSHAPRFILRQRPVAIDGRVPFFEPPDTQLAIACNYVEVEATSRWQLLEHTANRCDARTDLGSVRAEFGDQIPVPPAPPGNVTVATFEIGRPLWWSVLDLAYKAPLVKISINDDRVVHPFIVGTAGDQHILAVPPTLGYSSSFRPQPIRMMQLSATDGSKLAVSVHFSAIPIR